MTEQYHIIDTGSFHIVYDVLNGSFFSVPEATSMVIDLYYNKGMCIDEISETLEMSTPEILLISREYNVTLPYIEKGITCSSENDTTVWGVNLHVSHKCNLACSYCLVDGDYGNPILMNDSILEASLEYMVSKIGRIRKIAFYGGEPTLNIPAIKRTVGFFEECIADNRVTAMPSFSLITNGTKIDEHLAKFLVEKAISVGISIDGPESVHDANRKTACGNPSYKRIVESIGYLKESNATVSYSAVITPEHYERGVSANDIIRHLEDDLGMALGNVTQALSVYKITEILDYQLRETLDYLNDHLTGIPRSKIWLDQFLRRILSGQKITSTCPGGLTNFAISPEGDIYPCQGFVSNKDFKIGSVLDNVPFPATERYKKTINRLQGVTTVSRNDKCSLCWIRNMCNFCPLISLSYFNSLQPSDEYCDIRRGNMHRIIGRIGEIFASEEMKKVFVANYSKRIQSLNEGRTPETMKIP